MNIEFLNLWKSKKRGNNVERRKREGMKQFGL
jgi:hypothetical protein